jgi:hypothetical protein
MLPILTAIAMLAVTQPINAVAGHHTVQHVGLVKWRLETPSALPQSTGTRTISVCKRRQQHEGAIGGASAWGAASDFGTASAPAL